MTLEEAITHAVDYETRVRDLYAGAMEKVRDPVGRRFLETLQQDEQGHVTYLKRRLKILKETGVFDPGEALPSFFLKQPISGTVKNLEKLLPREDLGDEKQVLSGALQVEIETSAFYKKMVRTFSGEGQEMFKRFLEIEDAHVEAVRAELDYLSHTGYWFDFKEFDME